jgi:GntR family transcriptional regulator
MDFRDNQPIYLQIAEMAFERILLGKWAVGERMPSVRDLGIELQVNPNTVVRSYEFLEQKGIIANRRGVGYFVDDSALERIRQFRREQFLEQEMPIFLRNLWLLDIPMEEVQKQYEVYRAANVKS